MAYPNFSVSTSANVFPTPTNGLNVPCVVTLSGTGVSQILNRNTDSSNDTTVTAAGITSPVVHEKLDGQVTALANAGVQYVAPLATSSSLQLTAGLKDAQGNVVSAVNTFKFTSLNGLKSFTHFNPLIEIVATPSQTWHDNVATVSASGLVTANNIGYAIIQVDYPLDSANVNNFITAYIMITVTTLGVDVE